MFHRLTTLGPDSGGATAVEYSLIVALIVVGALAALTATGTSLSGFFTGVAQEISDNTPS